MNRKLLSLLLSAIACCGVSAQQTRTLTADKHNEYGIVYTLPHTSLCFTIEAQCTVEQAGEFYRYARKYVGADDVVVADSRTWDITSATMTPQGSPDASRRYLMQLKSGQDISVCVAGDGDGMLLAINKEASIPEQEELEPDDLPEPPSKQAYLQYVDEDFLVSQSSAKRAQMLAGTLLAVRESRLSLSRGTAETMPADGHQLELMLQNLGRQEKALTQAFTGTSTTGTATRTFTFTPDSAAQSRQVLCRISELYGFTSPDDMSGEPVYIELTYTDRPTLPVDEKGETKRLPKDAVIYALPATAHYKLTWRGETICEGTTQIAQGGTVFGLDPKLFTDKKAPSAALFDATTGALLSIEAKQK